MKSEPGIDHRLLIRALRDDYGLDVEALRFVPVGFVAACYAARVGGADRYFLKLWPNTAVGRESAARRNVSLRLARALRDRQILPRVPDPIPTRRGVRWSTFHGAPFAVFPYLSGRIAPEWSALTAAQRDEFARVLAAIHRAPPVLADVLPPRETFAVSFEDELQRGLEIVRRIGPQRGARGALKDFIESRRAEITDQLARLHRLPAVVRGLPGPFVLCHTDMGGDNLLIDDDGQFSVLDWDEATVAPPEHDLWSGAGDGFARFVEVYLANGGAAPLHRDHLAFCILRRALGDLTARLTRYLEDGTPAEELPDLLDGMERWGFARWRGLEQAVREGSAWLE